MTENYEECNECGKAHRIGLDDEPNENYYCGCKDNNAPCITCGKECENYEDEECYECQKKTPTHSPQDVLTGNEKEGTKPYGSNTTPEDTQNYYFSNSELPKFNMKSIEPTHTIVICSPENKTLTLDFNGEKLKTYGDLEYDKAAEIFFNSLDSFFQLRLQKEKDNYENKKIVEFYKGKDVTEADRLLFDTAQNNFKAGQELQKEHFIKSSIRKVPQDSSNLIKLKEEKEYLQWK